MIKAVIRGGLGNQLFQYASAYALAKRINQTLALDISFFPKQTLRGYKLEQFQIEEHDVCDHGDGLLEKIYKNKYFNGIVRRSGITQLPIRNGIYFLDPAGGYAERFFSIQAPNVLLNGYFQSEEYFEEYRSDLCRQLVPKYEADRETNEILQEIQTSNAVAVHVRHGDFEKDYSKYHYILDETYYMNALSEMRVKVENPSYFCFSDDIEWVKEHFSELTSARFVSLHTTHPDIDELMLMKHCKHIITANSTFSWWAAWLNENKDATIIVPNKAYGNSHMIPKTWMKI